MSRFRKQMAHELSIGAQHPLQKSDDAIQDVMEHHSVNEDDDDIESGSTSSLNSDTDSNDFLVPEYENPGPDPDDLGAPRCFGLHIRWVWPKQLQQLEDITSHAHIPGCSQCYCSERCDCTVVLLTAPLGVPSPQLLATLLFLCQSLWKQHAPQLDVRLVVFSMSQHWIVHLLKSQSEMWAPPSTATVQFHTYNPSGILFYQINSVMTDFLGVKLHGRLPWLIFDVGSGPAVVGSNSTKTFNGGQWHCELQNSSVMLSLYVGASVVQPPPVTSVMARARQADMAFATPYSMWSYPLLNAPDGFDAVSVQNVGSTYIIVSWDLPTHSNGILINFSLYCNGALAGVLPLTVISFNTTGLLPFTLYMYITLSVGQVLQSRPQALHSSWNVVLGVICAAASLPSVHHEEDSPPGGPPDPELDTDDIVISVYFINKITNPDKSFGSSVRGHFENHWRSGCKAGQISISVSAYTTHNNWTFPCRDVVGSAATISPGPLHPDISPKVTQRQERQKEAHDQHAKYRKFQNGDLVYAHNFMLEDGQAVRRHTDHVKARSTTPEPQVPKKTTAVQQDEVVDLPDIQEEAATREEEGPPMVDIPVPLADAVIQAVPEPIPNLVPLRRSTRYRRPPDRL
ncbi:hypothetical protein EMCRGX_G007013 [Ephydatia muelleri]